MKVVVSALGLLIALPLTAFGLQSSLSLQTASQAVESMDKRSALQSNASGAMNLTLQDAIRLALENNPSLKIEKIRVEQARSRIAQEAGSFDPLLNSTSQLSSRDNIIASRFYPTGLYTDKQKAQSLNVESRTPTGGRVTVGGSYADLYSNSNIQTLSPQHSASLSFSLSQPLLRDFGRGIAKTRLFVAERSAAIAEQNLSTRVTQLIQRVEEVYWGFTFLLKDLTAKRSNVELARHFLEQNENLLRAGRVAPVSLLQARAALAERERDAISSEALVGEYEDRLKSLLWLDPATTNLVPVEAPESPPIALDLGRSIESALLRRPEIRALRVEEEQRTVEVRFASNQLRPRLDLNAQFSTAGLSGLPNPACLDPTAAQCVPVGNSVIGSVLEGRTAVWDSFRPLWSRDPYESWSVELKLEVPLGNRSAKAQYTEASLRQMETKANAAAMRDQVSMEIRNAVRSARATEGQVAASAAAVAYVETQLEGMRRQLEAGLVTSYDVLQAFEEVDVARTRQLQALMDFNIALSKLRLAEASGLDRYGIEVEHDANLPEKSRRQAGTGDIGTSGGRER